MFWFEICHCQSLFNLFLVSNTTKSSHKGWICKYARLDLRQYTRIQILEFHDKINIFFGVLYNAVRLLKRNGKAFAIDTNSFITCLIYDGMSGCGSFFFKCTCSCHTTWIVPFWHSHTYNLRIDEDRSLWCSSVLHYFHIQSFQSFRTNVRIAFWRQVSSYQ
jgi:hypothetical protein